MSRRNRYRYAGSGRRRFVLTPLGQAVATMAALTVFGLLAFALACLR